MATIHAPSSTTIRPFCAAILSIHFAVLPIAFHRLFALSGGEPLFGGVVVPAGIAVHHPATKSHMKVASVVGSFGKWCGVPAYGREPNQIGRSRRDHNFSHVDEVVLVLLKKILNGGVGIGFPGFMFQTDTQNSVDIGGRFAAIGKRASKVPPTFFFSNWRANFNPRPLVNFHQIKLPSHRVVLVIGGVPLPVANHGLAEGERDKAPGKKEFKDNRPLQRPSQAKWALPIVLLLCGGIAACGLYCLGLFIESWCDGGGIGRWRNGFRLGFGLLLLGLSLGLVGAFLLFSSGHLGLS